MSNTLEVDIHVWINSLKNLLYVASFSSLSETTSSDSMMYPALKMTAGIGVTEV